MKPNANVDATQTQYIQAEFEVLLFPQEDVITTSLDPSLLMPEVE